MKSFFYLEILFYIFFNRIRKLFHKTKMKKTVISRKKGPDPILLKLSKKHDFLKNIKVCFILLIFHKFKIFYVFSLSSRSISLYLKSKKLFFCLWYNFEIHNVSSFPSIIFLSSKRMKQLTNVKTRIQGLILLSKREVES